MLPGQPPLQTLLQTASGALSLVRVQQQTKWYTRALYTSRQIFLLLDILCPHSPGEFLKPLKIQAHRGQAGTLKTLPTDPVLGATSPNHTTP